MRTDTFHWQQTYDDDMNNGINVVVGAFDHRCRYSKGENICTDVFLQSRRFEKTAFLCFGSERTAIAERGVGMRVCGCG